MSWLLQPEVLSLTIAILALVGTFGLAFAYGVRHRLAWAQLPEAARDAELSSRVAQREAELLDKDRRLGQLDEQIRDREAKLLERDQLESEADYWKSQVEAAKAEYAGLNALRTEIEEVRESYRQELESLADVERQAREAKGEVDDARMRVAEAERRLTQIADEDARLRASQEELTQAVSEVKAQLAAAKIERAEAEGQLKRDQNRAAELKREVDTLTDRQQSLQSKIDRGEEELRRLQAELNGLQPTLAQLAETQAKLEQAEQDLKAKYEIVSRLNSEEDWLNAQIARKQDELGELTGTGPVSSDGADDAALSDLVKPPACLAREMGDGEYDLVLPDPLPAEEERDALHRVHKHLVESKFVFHPRVVNAFHTSLKTAVISPLTVLAGISGTGKSQLPRLYAEAMGMHFLKIPVQPRWDGPQDLFGFYNYIEKRYKATDLARALVHLDPHNWSDLAERFQDRMLLVLLDEMNLARVEYYFSEFLSRLEGRPSDRDAEISDARGPAEIEIDVSRKGQTKRVYAGQNILFVGTMNEDESTLSLSDKVLDRANMLRFPKPRDLEPDLHGIEREYVAKSYLPKSRWTERWTRSAEGMDRGARDRATGIVADINNIMDGMGRPFGHRMGQGMLHYVANYPSETGKTNNLEAIDQALADQIELRILPRLRGVVIDEHRNRLNTLADVARDLRDDPLAEAIGAAVQSRDTNGLFVWRSFSRD